MKSHTQKYFCLVAIFLGILPGCATDNHLAKSPYANTTYQYRRALTEAELIKYLSKTDANLISLAHQASNKLLEGLKAQLDPEQPLLITSFVNVDDLSQSSTFGRISAEQFASVLSQQGLTIMETKLRREGLFIKEGAGEFILSRELKDLASKHYAQAILVGIYAAGDKQVYVTTKLVDIEGTVISSFDYVVPMDANMRSLIKS